MDNFVPLGYVSGISPQYGGRGGYYGLQFVPTNVFDGTDMVVGGEYNTYMSYYNSHHGNPSPLTVTFLSHSYSGDTACVSVKVHIDEDITEGNVVYIALWEDKVTGGSHTWRFTERDMPGYTVLEVNKAGQEQVIKKTFTLQGNWKRADLGATAFVQKLVAKNVLNARGTKLAEGIGVEPSSLGRVKALYQ